MAEFCDIFVHAVPTVLPMCQYCIRILTWNYGIYYMDQCITK